MNKSFLAALASHLVTTCLSICLLAACGSGGMPQRPMKTLVEIQVAPATPAVAIGLTQQFTAQAKFSDGSMGDVSSTVSWTSSDQSLATVNSTGLVMTSALGRTQITASSGTVSGSTSLIIVVGSTSTISRFAYVANMQDGTLSSFTINPSTGQLIHNGYQLVGSGPASVVVDPRGKYVYVANSNSSTISGFVIDQSGRLSPISGSPIENDSNPLSLAVDPSGTFLYAANSGTGNVSGYLLNPMTGALTPISGSPFAAGANPSSVVVDPHGKLLYVANPSSDNVSAFTIDPVSGKLDPVQGSPFPSGKSPWAVTLDPTGSVLYVANSVSSDVSVFNVNPTTGVLAPIAGSPFPTGAGQEISGVSISPNGKTVYRFRVLRLQSTQTHEPFRSIRWGNSHTSRF